MSTPAEVQQFYEANSQSWHAACASLRGRIEAIASGCASEIVVSGRVKTRVSAARKILLGSTPRAADSLSDYVGLRVVCSTQEEALAITAAIEASELDSSPPDFKAPTDDKLAYLGVHIDVRSALEKMSTGEPVAAEIQIRTRAQDAWAVMSHRLGYKDEAVPKEVRRSVTRLIALVEIFDDEIDRALDTTQRIPEAKRLRYVQRITESFESLVGEEFGTGRRSPLFDKLLDVYRAEEQPDTLISEFVQRNGEALERTYRQRRPGGEAHMPQRDWLLDQPESLAIAHLSEHRPMLLAAEFKGHDLEDTIHASATALWNSLA